MQFWEDNNIINMIFLNLLNITFLRRVYKYLKTNSLEQIFEIPLFIFEDWYFYLFIFDNSKNITKF